MKSRLIRWTVIGVLVTAVVTTTALFVPPPPIVTRMLVRSTANWLMSGDERHEGRLEQSTNRLLRSYVQTSVAAHLAKGAVASGGRDVQILARMMTAARGLVLSPPEPVSVRFDTTSWPALIAGVGHCDQINGAVCLIASRHFDKAELIALYSSASRSSPHTVGRVWSEERDEWLYFDAFYAKPVIYMRDEDGKTRFLQVNLPGEATSRAVAPPGVYDLPGWKISSFPHTFAGYMVARAWPEQSQSFVELAPAQKQETSTVAPPAPTRANEAVQQDSQGMLEGKIILDANLATIPMLPMSQRSDNVYRRVTRAYVDARLTHIFEGDADLAAYRAVAAETEAETDDRAAEVAAVAQRFAEGN